MTRDEILNMPEGIEMDTLIADKVIYWNHNHEINGCDDKWYSYCMICGYEPRFEEVKPGSCKGYPRYSADISEAWKVVEELRKSYDVVIDLDDELASCKILHRVDDEWKREVVIEQIFQSTPYAICRAALLAVLKL